jgi:hypothetical protein
LAWTPCVSTENSEVKVKCTLLTAPQVQDTGIRNPISIHVQSRSFQGIQLPAATPASLLCRESSVLTVTTEKEYDVINHKSLKPASVEWGAMDSLYPW